MTPRSLSAAERYEPADDLWVVTAYFNPCGYRTKRANFEAFHRSLDRSGIRWLAVECAFDGGNFDLEPASNVVRIRCRDVMWQKERLLNVAWTRLPKECGKAAWLDCDVLFENPLWAVETSRLLDSVPIVQPFSRAVRLPSGETVYRGVGETYEGYAAVQARDPGSILGGSFMRHGHTGFAWAARKEVLLKHGLYDSCIAGGGDHPMAHAFSGDWSSPCVDAVFGADGSYVRSFEDWAERLYGDVRGEIGSVPGTLLHLWHGDMADRGYGDRDAELRGFDFDPRKDLRVGPHGAWEWRSRKPALRRWAAGYFERRREDGSRPAARR